ncbi:GDSL-type esterase/lipase family protein [Terriglobus aquaticus]|uniref:GDSL-type esterase/lipase family protein n=1 Tax=Terriglobus aquaticus TaxID=940139 RepID=A0ABW9KGH9_9BACT|nr:GDSL-type esterase/lipase family protein [Terriglobus aquaticus]
MAQAGVVRTGLALATAVAVLAVAHWWPQRDVRGLAPTVIADAWQMHWPKRPVPVTPALPLNGVQQTGAQGAPGTMGKNPQGGGSAVAAVATSPVMVDDSHALDPFFQQLWALQQGKPVMVTVLHYGDSPTTADLITGDIREILQERFGDAGHGFNLGAKPWAWYGHRNVEMKDSGWASSQKDATGVGKMKQSLYGLGGAIFSGSAGAETTYTLRDAASAPATAVAIDYLQQPGGGTMTVAADGNNVATIDTNGPTAVPASRLVNLPAGAKEIKVAVSNGSVKWFGADFRHGGKGVIYDSLGLNGATTTVVSRTFDPAAWGMELQQAKPSLIVINYGTNESQFAGLVTTLEQELRAAVAKARAAAPGVPILIMSPMDRGEHGGMSEIHTNPQIPKIVEIQQKVAADTHCAFFNTYAAIGGDGTMARWYAAKPRLITADLIHPTPDGAVIVARLFVDHLYAAFDGWKQRNGIGVVRVMSATEAAAKKKEEAERRKSEAAKAKADAAKARAEGAAKKPAVAKKRPAKPATQTSPQAEPQTAP